MGIANNFIVVPAKSPGVSFVHPLFFLGGQVTGLKKAVRFISEL
jgi:hypothetical protein